MTYLLFITNIILAFGACGFIRYQNNIVRLCSVAFMTFFAEYVVCSGLLFWINVFSIHRALGIVALINLAIVVGGYLRYKAHFKIEYDFRAYLIPIIICVCAIPFVFAKFEFFGMGQDEGVYQTHAIQLIYGKTDIQQDFEEYETLATEEEKEYFKTALEEQLIGLYNYDPSLPFASEDKEISDVSAVFHGVPTFAAVLALWGKMFGIDHMSDVQTLFYLCTIFFLFFILEELGIKKSVKIVCTVLLAFSPLVIWVAKSALTEIQLACYVAAFVYFMIRGDKKSVYWSVVPIAAFSFFHITIYTMIPVILCLYWVGYLGTRRKEYIISCIITIAVFFLGMTMIACIAGTYSFVYNLIPIYQLLPVANAKNVMYIIWGSCFLAILVNFLLLRYFSRFNLKSALIRDNIAPWVYRIIVVITLLYQLKIIYAYKDAYNGFYNSFTHLTLFGFGLVIGIIIPAVSGVLSFKWTKEYFQNRKNIVIAILFIYCILVYSCLMRQSIAYFYYYARYLAPYLIIVIIYSALMLNKLSAVSIYLLGGLSSLIILPFSIFFVNHKDDTRVSWNIINDLTKQISVTDVIFINPEDMKFYYLPIRAMTGAKVYPALGYDEMLEASGKNNMSSVYYLHNGHDLENQWEVVYQNEFLISEDNNVFDGKYLPLPVEFSYRTQTVYCKKVFKSKYFYDFMNEYDELKFDGVGNKEDGFCWTNKKNMKLVCSLDKKDYILVIKQGGKIPLDAIGLDSYALKVYLNNVEVGLLEINSENNGNEIYLSISNKFINQGSNLLRIESNLWSPSQYGSNDERMLGIAIQSIAFIAQD